MSGPPEAGVVAGLDRDGLVLYGWTYFQEHKEHYYEKSDWFETMDRNAAMLARTSWASL